MEFNRRQRPEIRYVRRCTTGTDNCSRYNGYNNRVRVPDHISAMAERNIIDYTNGAVGPVGTLEAKSKGRIHSRDLF